MTKHPTRSSLREEGVILAYGRRGASYHGPEGMAAGALGSCHLTVRGQEEVKAAAQFPCVLALSLGQRPAFSSTAYVVLFLFLLGFSLLFF